MRVDGPIVGSGERRSEFNAIGEYTVRNTRMDRQSAAIRQRKFEIGVELFADQ